MNTDPNCGCNSPSGSDNREYLLVKSTASEANTCGGPTAAGGTANCPKQEPSYDISMSDFVMPQDGSSTPMEVCNASVYALSMWLHFSSPSAALQITNISGNILTLANKCPNGETIDSNPTNVVISKGTTFVVGPTPQCNTDAQDQERINSALASATELCMPNMKTSSTTATLRPVGKVESDTADLSVKKCIQAIYGVLFKAGTPILTALAKKTALDLNYERLGKHKTTNEVVRMDNYSVGLTSNASHTLMFAQNTEKVVPTYFTHMQVPRQVLFQSQASLNDFDAWDTIPGDDSFEKDISLKDYLEDLFNLRDHAYAILNIDVSLHTHVGGFHTLRCMLNDGEFGRVTMNNDSDNNTGGISITSPVKILKAGNYPLNLKLLHTGGSGTHHYYVKVTLIGAHY